ncbi:MAG: serine/threonine protein kinase [Rhodopirellula sp.]|nr:serine/threonine protein kinase [Rhodopirellula sp.]
MVANNRSSAAEVPIRQFVAGYEVEEELGRGGMGVVYRVRQQATDRILALKMILCGRGASFHELARFRIEAEAMACLNHPNIIKIRDVGVAAGCPFFALDWAERGSLKDLLRKQPSQEPSWCAALVRTLALAMQHAHGRGMLHRDLKPANVLIMGDGTPKISDFGLVKFAAPIGKVSQACCTFSISALDIELARFSRELGAQYHTSLEGVGEEEYTRRIWRQCAARTGTLTDAAGLHSVLDFLEQMKQPAQVTGLDGLDGLTRSDAVMGSPSYMAPEQAAGELTKISPRTDVYALGAILYELLTGRPPFRQGDFAELLEQVQRTRPISPRELRPELPEILDALCMKCLEKKPERRPASAQILANELMGLPPLGAAPIAALPPSAHQQARQQSEPQRPDPSPKVENREKDSSEQTATWNWWPFRSRR